MKIINIDEIEGTEFPAGRRTRVLVGPGSKIEGENFVQGYVVIYPDGYIPLHEHNEEETYMIISGNGQMVVDGEISNVKTGDLVYITPNASHGLKNTASQDLIMMFVYSPKVVAKHWEQETSGELK
jgi:quercetin dioxygenase-like cupin family protein